jgi:hypothetical protein
MTLRGQRATAADLYDSLLDSINVVFEDVVHGGTGQIDPAAHPVEYELYDNQFKAVDGPWYVRFVFFLPLSCLEYRSLRYSLIAVLSFLFSYAFLVHGKGPAVGGQGFVFDTNTSLTSSNIIIENNEIASIKCWNKEVPGTLIGGGWCCHSSDLFLHTNFVFPRQQPPL